MQNHESNPVAKVSSRYLPLILYKKSVISTQNRLHTLHPTRIALKVVSINSGSMVSA
jgi:hypothetical protein